MRYKLVENKTLEGKVSAVHDGDSIKVVFPTETSWVRLYGCDSPEVISNHVTENQPYGVVSGTAMRDLVKGKTVKVETLFKDVYGRMICRVSLDGKDLSEFLIENGYAWWLEEPKMTQEEKNKIRSLQDRAKSEKKGLWGQSTRKIRPSTWRKYHRRFSKAKLYEDLW